MRRDKMLAICELLESANYRMATVGYVTFLQERSQISLQWKDQAESAVLREKQVQ